MCDCLFCKMVKSEIPTNKLYEDENMIVIKDLNEKPKIHYLMIPKDHYEDITKINDEQAVVLGKCLKKVGELCIDKLKMTNGFRLANNCGEDGCQSIKHLHFHILGGEKLSEDMG